MDQLPELLTQWEQSQRDVDQFLADPLHKWARLPIVASLMSTLLASGAVTGLPEAYRAVMNLGTWLPESCDE